MFMFLNHYYEIIKRIQYQGDNKIMLPKLHKPPKLKPLALGDIMVAFINQNLTTDRTSQYKQMLGNHWQTTNTQLNNQDQTHLNLPEFAAQQYNQSQILNYHIENKTRDTQQYEILLHKVDIKIKQAMEDYGGRLRQGEECIQELMGNLESLCKRIQVSREFIGFSLERVQCSYMKVAPTLRKINNIGKVIDILSVWGKSKIPYLFSVDLAHPHRYNLKQLLQLFSQAQQNILSNPSLPKSQSLKTMLSSLQQKQKNLISSVCANIMTSIITFSSRDEYHKKYIQYLFVRDNGHCNDIFTQQGIKQVLIANSRQIYFSVLSKLTPNLNPDILNETVFLDFYEQVMQQFVVYFKNWHYVTTYHLQQSTAFSQLFLENRKNVFFIFCHKIAEGIQCSNKFISLQYKVKLQLVQKLQDFMEAGEKWMGTYENMQLPKIVTGKLTAELQRIFTLYNNLIKNILTQEISVTALENVDQSQPLHRIKSSIQVDGINYGKVSSFLFSGSNNSKIYATAIQKSYQQVPEPPQVRLKIGQVFAEMIVEYLERSKYLESNKSIYLVKIFQHFQFIIFMLYQVCVRDYLKQRLTTNILGEIQQNQTQKTQETASISWKTLNDLSKSLMFKKKYTQILQFLEICGKKYDGIKIAGIIDVNKVFESNSSDISNGYMKIIIRVISDLRKIIKWLIQVLPKTPMKGLRQVNKIAKLENVLMQIFCLILQNNLENVCKKYIDVVSPVIIKLKWEIKKFNQETANLYKQYKMKVLEAFRSTTLFSIVQSQCPQLGPSLADQEMQTLYRSLLELYGRIQKINDNGRQLIRMDCVEMGKILNEIGVKSDSWADWFDKYLDLTSQRSYKVVLEKMGKIGVLYEPVCWRYALMWIVGDMSTRQKKQYHGGIARLYMDYLGR